MSEYILNLLPLKGEEKAEFEAVAPDAVHVYAGGVPEVVSDHVDGQAAGGAMDVADPKSLLDRVR